MVRKEKIIQEMERSIWREKERKMERKMTKEMKRERKKKCREGQWKRRKGIKRNYTGN